MSRKTVSNAFLRTLRKFRQRGSGIENKLYAGGKDIREES